MRLYYDGLVVHQSHSDEGVIEVVDLGDSRSLHFGTYPRQSAMSMQTPHTLELSYTEAMMACLLFNQAPKNVLAIGLGGGSLIKFLLHHFPECQIDVVEYRQDVVKVAQNYFNVPIDNPKLRIHVDDGYQYVQQRYYQDDKNFDLLLIDAYDHIGMSENVGLQAFFDACAGVLSETGVMSINLWGTERDLFIQTMARIKQSFDGRTMVLPVENKGNIIGLAMKENVSRSDLKKLRNIVEKQEMIYQIGLPNALRALQKHNHSLIKRFFS